jgi:hypothetical protein
MMIWIQVLFFVITNAPTLIKAIRDLINAFQGDKQTAKELLQDMQDAKKHPEHNKDLNKALNDIIEQYKKKS